MVDKLRQGDILRHNYQLRRIPSLRYNKNQVEEISMEKQDLFEQRGQYVVKANDLIQRARYDLTAVQQRFLAYCISKIKPSDVEVPTFEIRVSDFCQVCGIDPNNFYKEFREMINDFHDKELWIRNGKDLIFWMWFSRVVYHEGEGSVTIKLSEDMGKYLLGLAKNFTRYELYNILALRSKYAIRMFELFKSYEYRNTIRVDVDDLKQLLYIDGYSNFADFRKRVLAPALKEINAYTELMVTMEEIRRGHRIATVVFHITGKTNTEKVNCFNRVEHLLDGENLDQMSLFDRGAHNGND